MVVRKDIGNVDSALVELGQFGLYTQVQFWMQMLAQVAVAHHMLSIVFTGQQNPFRCLPQSHGNASVHHGGLSSTNVTASNVSETSSYGYVCQAPPDTHSSSNSSTCNAYSVQYQLPKDRYFVSEFDLVCEREYLAGLTQTLLTLGHAIGAFSVPYFADNHGRKPVLLVCAVLWLGSALALAFSANYTMFAIFKTLGGICLQAVAQTSVTVMVEILTGKQRGYMFGCLGYIVWTLGIILMVPVAYVLQEHSWRIIELAYCSYFVFILLYIFCMDESLRWLAANGLKERVVWVLKKASRWNGANFEQVLAAFYKESETELNQYNNKQQLTAESDNEVLATHSSATNGGKDKRNGEHGLINESGITQSPDAEAEHLSFVSLFTRKNLRFYAAFSVMAWFFNSLTYYGLFLMSSSLSGSLYLNYFLNSVVELPSAAFIYFYIDRLGRKMCLASFSFTAGISLVGVAITAAVYSPQNIVITILAIIGKFGISGSFATIYTMTPELLPTTIRNTGLGLANMSACVGGMLAPFAGLLMSHVVYGPGLIFGSGSLVIGVWTFFLPETANRQLPQSLRDMNNWSKEPKTTRDMCTCWRADSQKEAQDDIANDHK
ncbi:hypothetical protein BsWGS_04589 [Bradybaena similaris]